MAISYYFDKYENLLSEFIDWFNEYGYSINYSHNEIVEFVNETFLNKYEKNFNNRWTWLYEYRTFKNIISNCASRKLQ